MLLSCKCIHSLHKSSLLSHFYINIKKTEITSPEKVSTIPSEFKHIFADCFTFLSVCHDYILVIQLSLFPVIFTSRMLSNTSHRLILLFDNKK